MFVHFISFLNERSEVPEFESLGLYVVSDGFKCNHVNTLQMKTHLNPQKKQYIHNQTLIFIFGMYLEVFFGKSHGVIIIY